MAPNTAAVTAGLDWAPILCWDALSEPCRALVDKVRMRRFLEIDASGLWSATLFGRRSAEAALGLQSMQDGYCCLERIPTTMQPSFERRETRRKTT
jgi:hypothetical protein